MLTYSIMPKKPARIYTSRHGHDRFRGKYETDAHKEFIFNKVDERNTYIEGDNVTHNGRKAVVTNVAKTWQEATWYRLECCTIEIFYYDTQKSVVVHHRSLKHVPSNLEE